MSFKEEVYEEIDFLVEKKIRIRFLLPQLKELD